jgi:plasmid maintenance system antidote protein VapI/Zn-dependent peptidase ImmA (M78 family)
MNESSSFRPNWTSPPGDTISDILKERKLSVCSFASELNQPQKYVDGLLMGEEAISAEVAKKLASMLGGSADFWLTREHQYREDLERITRDEHSQWLKELPVKDMTSFGWISSSSECLSFFNVPNVKAWRNRYDQTLAVTAFRQSSTFRSEYGAVAAWLRQGEILGSKIECAPWNAGLFENSLESIKALTRKKSPKEFLPLLKSECAKCGVALAIVPTPNGCRASGATRFINKNRALLLLSFRYLSDDQFWFTFFHEVGHLLLHGSETAIIEGLNENDFDREKEANLFAGEVLIPHALHQKLSRVKGNKRDIVSFAVAAGVSPGIVVGQMQHHGYINKRYLNAFKRRYTWEEIFD